MSRENLTSEAAGALDALEGEFHPVDLKEDYSKYLMEEFQIGNAEIAELGRKYLPLKIAGVEDKQGYAVVHEARMEMKSLRIAVEKTRKRLNEAAQERIRTVNGEAKRITGLAQPIESHLEAEERRIDAEVECIKAAEQAARDKRNQSRVDALLAVGVPVDLSAVVLMSDPDFNAFLALATESFRNAQALAAKEAADAKAKEEAEAAEKARKDKEDADRLQAEREANAAAKAENDRIAAELKAERDEIEKDKADRLKAQEDEAARKEAAEKAAAKVDQDAKNEEAAKVKAAQEEKARIEAATIAAAAIEAARPDAEKLEGFAHFLEGKAPPEMATPAGQAVAKEIKGLMMKLTAYTRTAAANLTK